MSSHRLEVEVGIWKKLATIPYADRLCTLCHKLEDEFHFIFECDRYRDEYRLYFTSEVKTSIFTSGLATSENIYVFTSRVKYDWYSSQKC